MNHKKVLAIAGLVVTAALTLSGCSTKLGVGSSEPTPTPSITASATPSATPDAGKQKDDGKHLQDPSGTLTAVEASMTLDEDLWGDLDWDYPDAYAALVTKYEKGMKTKGGVTYPVFVIGSTLPGKLWTDSVRPRLTTKTIEEVYAHILAEPDYGWHVCSGLAHSSITGGKSLLELSPWLADCYDPAGINDWAQAAMDGTPAEKLVVAKKLALVVMLLEQLHNPTVGQESTAFNYHLVVGEDGGVMSIDPKNPFAIPEFELSPVQYVGEFLTIEITFKGQTGCWLRIGFNTGDGRFAGFACETPVPPSGNCEELGNCPPPPPPGCEELGNCNPCPPGNEIPDCAPKDTDGTGYVFPGDGKPAVDAGALTGDTAVQTEVIGGGGVVDSSSNDAGAETGVQTGDADSVGTDVRNHGGNQGGDNGAGDPGAF